MAVPSDIIQLPHNAGLNRRFESPIEARPSESDQSHKKRGNEAVRLGDWKVSNLSIQSGTLTRKAGVRYYAVFSG